MKAQICVLAGWLNAIGGIETFVYNWCDLLKDTYDIVVAARYISATQKNRLKRIVKVVDYNEPIECDVLLVMHISAVVPDTIKYNKKIQMVHGCKSIAYNNIPKCDILVPVSDTAKESYGNELDNMNVKVIQNVMKVEKPKKILKLISATRLTSEKGGNRIIELASQLEAANISFIWYVFSNSSLSKKDKIVNGIIQMPPTLDISSWIKECDYLVQLSDTESFGYSIVESLMLGVPVIVTPLKVLDEIGFKDGVNGFIVPFDMNDIDINKIYKSDLKFEYKYDNKVIANKWLNIIGEPKPFVKYKYMEVFMKVKALKNYTDTLLDKKIKQGDVYETTEERAKLIIAKKFGKATDEPINVEWQKEEVKAEVKEVVAREEIVEVAVPEVKKEKATAKRKVVNKNAKK